MSKQQAAPGELEHVRAFVNTLDVETQTEELVDGPALIRWLVARGLGSAEPAATGQDLSRAIGLREALRQILRAHNEGERAPDTAYATLDEVARRAKLRLRFDERGAALEPEAGGIDGALGRLLAIVHGAMAQRTWTRLKACREDACEWAFYDHTRNRSGTWCRMDVCGNRAKARAYRERRATRADSA